MSRSATSSVAVAIGISYLQRWGRISRRIVTPRQIIRIEDLTNLFRRRHSRRLPLPRRLSGQRQFIAKGEGSPDRYHQQDCAFYLGRSEDRSVYALRITDYGDPDNCDS